MISKKKQRRLRTQRNKERRVLMRVLRSEWWKDKSPLFTIEVSEEGPSHWYTDILSKPPTADEKLRAEGFEPVSVGTLSGKPTTFYERTEGRNRIKEMLAPENRDKLSAATKALIDKMGPRGELSDNDL